MIKFYPLTSMQFTPFGTGETFFEAYGREKLRNADIIRTKRPDKCDFFVTRIYPLPRRLIYKHALLYGPRKPVFVWTHEPRYCTILKKKLKTSWILPDVHIMNLFTGDLALNNFSFYGWAIKSVLNNLEEEQCVNLNPKKIAAIMTYIGNPQSKSLVKDGRDLDLTVLRQNLAIAGYRRGMVDIYGRFWPEEYSSGVSKGKGWHEAKNRILADYHFNICLENTNVDYYCTEKIWDSIRGYCLPIYYGKGNRIYEDFPPDSFIDVAEFGDTAELFNYITKMDAHEYCDRMNKCIDTYNNFAANENFEEYFDSVVKKTAGRIKSIVSG